MDSSRMLINTSMKSFLQSDGRQDVQINIAEVVF